MLRFGDEHIKLLPPELLSFRFLFLFLDALPQFIDDTLRDNFSISVKRISMSLSPRGQGVPNQPMQNAWFHISKSPRRPCQGQELDRKFVSDRWNIGPPATRELRRGRLWRDPGRFPTAPISLTRRTPYRHLWHSHDSQRRYSSRIGPWRGEAHVFCFLTNTDSPKAPKAGER